MSSHTFENEFPSAFDKQSSQDPLNHLSHPILDRFDRITKNSVRFHLSFLCLGLLELSLLFSFLTLLDSPASLALSLAIFFLTIFSYFVIRLYLQTKKPEQLRELCEEFFTRCKAALPYQEGEAAHHVNLANAACKLAALLHEKEYGYYSVSAILKSCAPTCEKISCFFHWKDLYLLKEMLLDSAIVEHIKVVKYEPTNLEVHASLANAYVMLSSLYADPRKFEGYNEQRWIPKQRLSPTMQARFRATAERAIEEFKILNDYAPNDPWVHIQLAFSYHDLHMPEEEIKEYETILKLCPGDTDTLFKLGMLYFQQGRNAQGLRIYKLLKNKHDKKAEGLIKYYGTYELSES